MVTSFDFGSEVWIQIIEMPESEKEVGSTRSVYFVCVAIQHRKREKVVEFFEIHGAELQGNPEWVRWFGMCFALSFLSFTP